MDSVIQLLASSGVGAMLTLIIKGVIDHVLNKKQHEQDLKDKKIQTEITTDTYWENRFKGLKVDYADREKYFETHIQDLEANYKERLEFQSQRIEKLQNDYNILSEESDKKDDKIEKLQEKILELTDKITDLSINGMIAPSALDTPDNT